MKRWIGLTILGVVAYLGFLIAYLPATAAYGLVEEQTTVRVYGLHGTLWEGEAAAVTTGPRRIENLAWDLNPWALFTGSIASQVKGDFPEGKVDGYVNLGMNNSVSLSDFRVDVPVGQVLSWAGRSSMTSVAKGRGEIFLRSAHLEGQRLMSADGIVNWNNAVISFGGDIPLGNVALKLQPSDEPGIRGELVTQGGVMDISGNLSLEPNGAFQINARLAARDPNNAKAQRFMSMLRLANPEGVTEVTITGSLQGDETTVRQRSG